MNVWILFAPASNDLATGISGPSLNADRGGWVVRTGGQERRLEGSLRGWSKAECDEWILWIHPEYEPSTLPPGIEPGTHIEAYAHGRSEEVPQLQVWVRNNLPDVELKT